MKSHYMLLTPLNGKENIASRSGAGELWGAWLWKGLFSPPEKELGDWSCWPIEGENIQKFGALRCWERKRIYGLLEKESQVSVGTGRAAGWRSMLPRGRGRQKVAPVMHGSVESISGVESPQREVQRGPGSIEVGLVALGEEEELLLVCVQWGNWWL